MPRHKQNDQSTIKNQVIRLRVTEAEAKLFKANATAAGCKSISEYIRFRCISEDSGVATTVKTGIVKKCAVREYPKSVIDRYQAAG